MKISPQLAVVGFGIGLAAGVIYLAREFWQGAQKVADKVLDPITTPIAQAIVGPGVTVKDGFVLPGGRTVTFTQLIGAGGKVAGDQTLVWQGVKYRLTSRNADGWYMAERA